MISLKGSRFLVSCENCESKVFFAKVLNDMKSYVNELQIQLHGEKE